MNNISFTASTADEVLDVMEQVGFTIDKTNGRAYWGNDTNGKLFYKVFIDGSYIRIRIHNSSDTYIDNLHYWQSGSAMKMTYEIIGQSIVFGFNLVSYGGNLLMSGVVEPIEPSDDWRYFSRYNGTGAQDYHKVINGRTEDYMTWGLNALYGNSALGIQLVKFYDGAVFCGNIFLAPVSEYINAVSGNTTNNFAEATVGNDTYLVINLTTSTANTKLAIKKVS